MKPILTICVPTNDNYMGLWRCLWELNRQTWKKFKVLIVDDNEKKEDIGVKDLKFEINVVNTEGISGLFPVHQIGLVNSDTDFVMRLADDVLLDKDFLAECMPAIENNEKCAAISGIWQWFPEYWEAKERSAFDKNSLRFWKCPTGIAWTWSLMYQFCMHQKDETVEVDHLYNSYIYRRNWFNSIGGFQVDLLDGEETFPLFKSRCFGMKVLCQSKALMYHNHPLSRSKNKKRLGGDTENYKRKLIQQVFDDLHLPFEEDGKLLSEILKGVNYEIIRV